MADTRRSTVRSLTASLAAGAVVALGAAPAAGGPTSFGKAEVKTGTHEGRAWIKVALDEPFPGPSEKPSAAVSFSLFTPDGAHVVGFTQVHAGAASSGGLFARDSAVTPGAPVPVEARLSPDRRTVVFFVDEPDGFALDPADLRYRVQLACLEVAGGTATVTDHPADGETAEFRDKERDPDRSDRARAKAKKGPAKKATRKG